MAVITISRGSYSKGREIAERVAQELGYACISREVLLEASEHFNIPEVKLVRALHDAPSILERFTRGQDKYVAFIERAFLERVQSDNLVYHGLAGHFFLPRVAHALKVRIIADLEDRARLEAEREGITVNQARRILQKDDEERRKWALHLYGLDTANPRLYDLCVHIRKLTADDAVDLIVRTARLPEFRTTEQSRQRVKDLLLAAQARSAIVERWPRAKVEAKNGRVTVHTRASLLHEQKVADDISKRVGEGCDAEEVSVHIDPLGPDMPVL